MKASEMSSYFELETAAVVERMEKRKPNSVRPNMTMSRQEPLRVGARFEELITDLVRTKRKRAD